MHSLCRRVGGTSNFKRLAEVRARKNGLGLAQSLDLLVHRSLADLEVLHDEVAALVELGRVLGQTLKLRQRRLEVAFGLHEIALGLGLVLAHHHERLLRRLDGIVGVLQEGLVGVLRVALGHDGLALHVLRVVDDALEHRQDASGARARRVLLEPRRRRSGGTWGLECLVLRLQEGFLLLLVESLEARKRFIQDLLGRPLVSNSRLELGVLGLAVLARALRLRLHLSNLGLLRTDVRLQGVNRRFQVSDLGLDVALLVRPNSSCLLVLGEVGDAEVAVLDLVGFLLLDPDHHFIDCGDHFGESVQLGCRREHCNLGAAALLRDILENRNCLAPRSLRLESTALTCVKPSVLENMSCASSSLRIEMASETAAISSLRVFVRSAISSSVCLHFSLRSMRNFSSAESASFVDSRSSFAVAPFSSVSASSTVFVSTCFFAAAISASLADFICSYSSCAASSSFCDVERFDSKVSFICLRMPKIWPDCGA